MDFVTELFLVLTSRFVDRVLGIHSSLPALVESDHYGAHGCQTGEPGTDCRPNRIAPSNRIYDIPPDDAQNYRRNNENSQCNANS